MPWKETFTGHYERPFDSIEDFHRANKAAGAPLNKEHYSVRASATFRCGASLANETAAILRHAWKTMRYDFPQLAALDRDGVCVYEVPDNTHLDAWLSSTFVIEPQGITAPEELYALLKPSELMMMYYFPRTSQLLLYASHWRIDGIGLMHLFHNFFGAVACPRAVTFGDEGKNLSIGLDEANGVRTYVRPEADQKATNMLMSFVNNAPSIGLPIKSCELPSRSQRCEIELTSQLTSEIVSRCKANGFSVTVAVHAALICATSQFANREYQNGNDTYTSFTAFDLRKYSPAPYNGTKNAVSNFHTGIPTVVTPSTFLGNAYQVKKQYAESFTVSGPNSLFTFLGCYVRKVCALLMQPPSSGALPPTEPPLNSLGIIDRFLHEKYGDKIEVLDFWIGVEMITRQLNTYVWTWHGRLRLSICYNEAFYDLAFVEKFLKTVKEILLEGLKV
ncbi:hypothetical protein MMC28_005862 [Mycoblastus sanguinarius]|nr:hypothetical protein [Mycoblastus sanguinarius]